MSTPPSTQLTADLPGVIQSDVHLPTSTLFLHGEINAQMANHLAKSLHVLDLHDRPISIYLNTVGGDRSAALGMYDLIRACKQPVLIVGYGEVASGGILILQAGDVRLLSNNCMVLVHPGYSQTGYDLDENTRGIGTTS
jgi:ATP-dependent Clp protease protease subunit